MWYTLGLVFGYMANPNHYMKCIGYQAKIIGTTTDIREWSGTKEVQISFLSSPPSQQLDPSFSSLLQVSFLVSSNPTGLESTSFRSCFLLLSISSHVLFCLVTLSPFSSILGLVLVLSFLGWEEGEIVLPLSGLGLGCLCSSLVFLISSHLFS